MAGIGFELRRLGGSGTLSGSLASVGHASFVTAGPWLLTVVALSIVQKSLASFEQTADAYLLQALVIYTFCLTLIVTAPLTVAAVRKSSDELYAGRLDGIGRLFLAALGLSLAAGMAVALLVFGLGFSLRGTDLALAAATAGGTAMIWPSIAFCSMVRAYRAITTSFVFGLAVSVLGTLWAEHHGLSAGMQAAAFSAGLGLAALALAATVLATFPSPAVSLAGSIRDLVASMRGKPEFALGALAAAMAIWIDSWVVWSGPLGAAAPGGLPTAPFYDSAMFIARLSMLPGLIMFLITVDTDVHRSTRLFLAAINDHGTLDRIGRRRVELDTTVNRGLLRLIVVQAAISAILLALAPALIAPASLQYQQIGILRFGILGALFNTVFFATATLLLHFGRGRAFLLLQTLFLAANGIATALVSVLPPAYLGLGYLAATALCATAALTLLAATMRSLDRLVFGSALDERDAVVSAASEPSNPDILHSPRKTAP